MKRWVHAVGVAASVVGMSLALSVGPAAAVTSHATSGYIQEIGPAGYIQE